MSDVMFVESQLQGLMPADFSSQDFFDILPTDIEEFNTVAREEGIHSTLFAISSTIDNPIYKIFDQIIISYDFENPRMVDSLMFVCEKGNAHALAYDLELIYISSHNAVLKVRNSSAGRYIVIDQFSFN